MSNQKVTELPVLTAPRGEDLLHVIDDATGTATNKKILLSRVTDVINVINYGADLTGVADSTAAIVAAIDFADDLNAASEGGQVVYFPYGLYKVTSTITVPNKVRLRGVSARGSILKADAAFSGSYILDFVNGTTAMFDTGVSRMTLNCSSVSSLSAIRHNAPHENTEFDNILVSNFDTYGLEVANAYQGASHFLMTNTEFAPDNGATSIYHNPGSFGTQIIIRGMTLHGDATASKGIHLKGANCRILAEGLHVEKCTSGVYVEGSSAQVVLLGMIGESTTVTMVEHDDAGNNRRTHMIGCNTNSGTNFFSDGTYTETANIADFKYPHLQAFEGDATPSVGNRASTYQINGSGTPITAFDDAVDGQSWLVSFAGTITVDLSANSKLVGNGGSDFSAVVGDGMWCRHYNGVTYCWPADKA